MENSNIAPLPDSELELSVDERLIADAARSDDPAQRLLVINLTTSHSPLRLPSLPLPDSPPTYVYQIQRREDHRTRFRLRVGPVSATEHPERLLAQLRGVFPGAFVSTAGTDDLLEIARCHDRPPQSSVDEASTVPAHSARSPSLTAHAPGIRDQHLPVGATADNDASGASLPPLHRQFLPTLTEVVYRKK